MKKDKLRVAHGFLTGRASFKEVVRASLLKWRLGYALRSGYVDLSLFVVFYLDYIPHIT